MTWTELLAFVDQLRPLVAAAAQKECSGKSDEPAGDEDSRLLRAREAARLLGVSPSYLYEHRAEYPFTRNVGRAVRFDRRGLLTWMAREAAGA